MTNGWFESLVDKTGKKYLSYSSIKLALQDIALFELYMQGRLKKTSKALTFGSAYDCLLFTPEVFDDQFYVLDDAHILNEIGGKSPAMTKKYKEWKAIEQEKATGKELISEEDYTQCVDMITRLDDSGVRQIYLEGDFQVEFLQEIDFDGITVPVRGFLDTLGDGFISDSKSSRSVKGFSRDVISYGYDIQAYIYTQAFGVKDFYWVVQEKAYPYLPAVFKASEETLDFGKKKVAKALNIIKSHYEEGGTASHFFIQGEI
tara:strand:+ start:3490 stop:4269 length:780 start_codon:yes stop_codon:yes gene_type:complete